MKDRGIIVSKFPINKYFALSDSHSIHVFGLIKRRGHELYRNMFTSPTLAVPII